MQDANKPLGNEAYQVYALVDPRDKTIRYVGVSINAHIRLTQHMREAKYQGEKKKRAWLAELEQQGLQPILEILETVDAGLFTTDREKYWIDTFLDAGAPLTNIARNPHARHSRRSNLTIQDAYVLDESSLTLQEEYISDENDLNPQEACDYLGVSRSTLERYADAGRVTKYRRGVKRGVFFKKSELNRMLEIHPDEKDDNG